MSLRQVFFSALLLSCCGLCLADEQNEELFVRRIAPLLQQKCVSCHGDDATDLRGGLDLRSFAGTQKGGESGVAAVVAGRVEKSPLYLAVMRDHAEWPAMPPKEAEQLTAEQIAWIRDWITGGAAWPGKTRAAEIAKIRAGEWTVDDGITVATSGGQTPDWNNRKYKSESLWAYQPLEKDPHGRLRDADQHPIDILIQDRMPAALVPAPRADRITLIRRATFDLTGLPPTPDEVSAFVSDPREDSAAVADVVERLLASPHYGEQMARHWLDVVRYADSSGFSNDYERGNAWRYRDYVVRSFNSDKPWDQFVREQIAGDEIDPQNPEMLVAVGFLRMGPWELTGMEVAKIARQRFLDDVTNSVGETFLAHSLQCARCHDHKFDPVPTRDYYSIQAVFATTQIADRPAPFLSQENTAGFEEERFLRLREREYRDTLQTLDGVLLQNADKWFAENNVPQDDWNAALDKAKDASTGNRDRGGLFNAVRGMLMKQGVPEHQFPPKLVGFTSQQYGLERLARKGLERLNWELERYQPVALSVYDGRTPEMKSVNSPLRVPQDRMLSGELEETCILTGGDPFASGEHVRPGVLTALAAAVPETQKRSSAVTAAEDAPINGRRKEFADWVASPHNPLTPRVIANRIWLWHFHEAVAGNPNNFGATGKRPVNPELLDWLAATLLQDGYSIKSLHRRIMTSDAYCRSSEYPDRVLLEKHDPEGTSFAVFKPRRLSAEELRDSMLAVTGELNRQGGGIPCRPEINLEAALQPRMVMGTFAAAWTPNPLPQQRHRRSLYALKLRGLADPLLEVFNAPSPDFSCERRENSIVTPQVFTLFNGQTVHQRALALAQRVLHENDSSIPAAGQSQDEQIIARCFSLLFSRAPIGDESAACVEHWHRIEALLPEQAAAFELPPLVINREAVEENTGEDFSFQETIYANAEFVADLQPSQTDRRTRALADVCLALLNSSEFLYVY